MPRQSLATLTLSFTATAPITVCRACGFDGAMVAAAGAKVFGVSDQTLKLGEAGTLTVAGTTVIETGGAFPVGASLVTDAQGRAVAVSGPLAVAAGATAVQSAAADGATVLTGADLPEFVFADALEASAGAGRKVEVLLRR